MEKPPFYIYVIRNKINDKLYVGVSLQPKRRFYLHTRADSHCHILRKAIAKYGVGSFEQIILESWENETDANEAEIYWIKFLGSQQPLGYNISSGGLAHRRGASLTPKQKEKFFYVRKGEKLPEAHRLKMVGRKVSPEALKNMSLAQIGRISPMKGRKHTAESKAKMSVSQKKRAKPSAETLKKMSLSRIGMKLNRPYRPMPDETKKKLSASIKASYLRPERKAKSDVLMARLIAMRKSGMTGKHHSEETKKKLSEARAGRKWTPEIREKMMRGRNKSNTPTNDTRQFIYNRFLKAV